MRTLEERFESYAGESITAALRHEDVLELMLNPDGALFADTQSRGSVDAAELSQMLDLREPIGATSAETRESLLRAFSSEIGDSIGGDRLYLEGEADLFGVRLRISGAVPSMSAGGPMVVLRKPPTKIFALGEGEDSFLAQGVVDEAQLSVLRGAVRDRKRLLIVGATRCGKTTFANGVLAEVAWRTPRDRVGILEDSEELQCAVRDKFRLKTVNGLPDAVKRSLRFSPTRLVVGETRDEAVMDVLMAWRTGHEGGLTTFHAGDADDALDRILDLCRLRSPSAAPSLVYKAVDLVVAIERRGGYRRVKEICTVDGYDDAGRRFLTTRLAEAAGKVSDV